MDTFQILVLVGLAVLAVITVISLAWAFYLGGEVNNRPSPKHYSVEVETPDVLSADDLQVISEKAFESMDGAVGKAAEELGAALTATIAGLTTKTEDMAKIAFAQEFEKYQTALEALREETIKEFADLQKQLDERRDQLMAGLELDVQKDREERMEAFNARINDVVSSYLVETLDKGVDLGAQAGYIVRMLESHKEDIKKDVLS